MKSAVLRQNVLRDRAHLALGSVDRVAQGLHDSTASLGI